VLAKVLRLSLKQLLELLAPGYDTSHLVNAHQPLEQAIKAVKIGSGLTVDTVVIEECSVMSLVRGISPLLSKG